MSDDPLAYRWDGEALRPVTKRMALAADERFVVGQVYRMVEENEQSDVSRAHEFAWLREAWQSLPDELRDQYPSQEHLRKYALIDRGYCTMTQHDCGSVPEAERFAKGINQYVSTYAIVRQRGRVVTVYTAVSQSRRKMGAPQFQASKQAIMEFVGDLLGVDPETLGKQTEAA